MRRIVVAGNALAMIGLLAPVGAQQERPAAIPVDLRVPFAPHPVSAEGQRHRVTFQPMTPANAPLQSVVEGAVVELQDGIPENEVVGLP